MTLIKGKNTGFELSFLKLLSSRLHKKGYRYRKYYAKVVGKPDIAFPKYKLAVFLDSDFWHGYNLKKLDEKLPNKFWSDKIERNIKRDKKVRFLLEKQGWQSLRFWEHDIKKDPASIINKIEKNLNVKSKNSKRRSVAKTA